MGNTTFYQEAGKNNPTITWKDIFSESFVKHTKADLESAMQAGTVVRQVPESRMLDTWTRPWLWWPAAKYGVGLILILYAAYFFCFYVLRAVATAVLEMMIIIPPIVIPFVIMIFLWELNIPQNISLLDMVAFFFVGGLVSFVITSAFFPIFPSGLPSWYAAFREEPAKLGASLLIMYYYNHKQGKKLYGISGLVIGAAVGAAFSGIESVSYAIANSGQAMGLIDVQLKRAVFAIAGHITYCVPYSTAIALNAENGKLTWKSVFNPKACIAFALSIVMHAAWNGLGSLLVIIILMVASVFVLLYWVRLALQQIVRICAPQRSRAAALPASTELTLYCTNTALQGTRWKVDGGFILIGRQRNACRLCYDENVKGVSRQHCKVYRGEDGNWYVQDLDSTYGTYAGGRKLAPYESCQIRSGDRIYLGSKQVCLSVM